MKWDALVGVHDFMCRLLWVDVIGSHFDHYMLQNISLSA